MIQEKLSKGDAPKLAQSLYYLNWTIALYVPLRILLALLASEQTDFSALLLLLLQVISSILVILLYVEIYIAAMRLGFRKVTVILSLLFSFLVPILFLILIISAETRLVQQLKTLKWKVGLLKAYPA